jgi:hypothetical protein
LLEVNLNQFPTATVVDVGNSNPGFDTRFEADASEKFGARRNRAIATKVTRAIRDDSEK